MKEKRELLQFSGKTVGILGILLSICIAVGLPALILIFGQGLGVAIQMTLIILCLIFGSIIGITLGFFAIVIPTRVNQGVMPDMSSFRAKDGENYVEWGQDGQPQEQNQKTVETLEP